VVISLKEKGLCEDDLNQSGLKKTKSRKAIVDFLMKSKQPIAAEELYLKLRENKLEVNLSTVYRTLDALVAKGIVSKISLMDNDRMLFEYNRLGHRHYLVCVDCKKIITIQGCPLDLYEKQLEKETNFKIAGHKLYLY
jgi:Fur family ferric uptake transcriptional regulator